MLQTMMSFGFDQELSHRQMETTNKTLIRLEQ